MFHTRRLGVTVLSCVLLVASTVAPLYAADVKGVLTIGYATLFDENLNPMISTGPPKAYYDVMYEYLIYNHPQTLKLEPGLAERWRSSPDGKSWVFFLRKGVKFSDGTEMTAEDVKFSHEQIVRKASRWPTKLSMMPVQARVVDRHTIAFDAVDRGVAEFDVTLAAYLGLPIVSKASYEKLGERGYDTTPLGTGPYVFKARRAGDFVSFEARPDWRSHWRVGDLWAKQGAFKEIVFKKVPEVASRTAMLRTGEVDIAEITVDVVAEVEQAGMQVQRSPGSYAPVVTFHGAWLPSRPTYDAGLPWTKPAVRKALSLAVNRTELADKFYFRTAAPTAGQLYFFPALPGWNPNLKPDAHDPARAKALLAEAGFPRGFTIPLRLYTMPGVGELPLLGEAVAGYWEKIGVKAELIRTEWAVHRPDIAKRTFKGATVYRGYPSPDLTAAIRLSFHSAGDFGMFEDARVDALIDRYATTIEPKARETVARNLADLLHEQTATIPLVSAAYLYGVNGAKVKGWAPTRGKYPDRFEFAAPGR